MHISSAELPQTLRGLFRSRIEFIAVRALRGDTYHALGCSPTLLFEFAGPSEERLLIKGRSYGYQFFLGDDTNERVVANWQKKELEIEKEDEPLGWVDVSYFFDAFDSILDVPLQVQSVDLYFAPNSQVSAVFLTFCHGLLFGMATGHAGDACMLWNHSADAVREQAELEVAGARLGKDGFEIDNAPNYTNFVNELEWFE